VRAVADPLLAALRPKPFRGDVVAAGAVVLVTWVWLVEARLHWAAGVHLLVAATCFGLVTAMAWLAPMERETPRAYQSVLYVGSVALLIPALANLADVLGADHVTSGTLTWTAALVDGLALAYATRRNSAVSTLLASIAGGVAVVAAIDWVFDPHSVRTFRWVFLGLMVVFGISALGQRDRRRRHAVALVDAAGLACVAIGVTLVGSLGLVGSVVVEGQPPPPTPNAPAGWELLLVAAGFGLIAYSSVDREPGPAYFGVLNLALFVVLASGGSFLGWPLFLLVAAGALLVIGLRPTTPAPPPPDADVPPADPLPLR
jgi:hypothetical protein